MASAYAQNRFCSASDFQSCKSCTQLDSAIDLKNPDAGDYYRGAEWNGLYTAYILNCQKVATKLLKAGANPSSGGSSGSMILTVADKWPHKNKKINEAWASLLLASGANVNMPLNWRDGQNTKQLLKEETWYNPSYPDLLSLFEHDSLPISQSRTAPQKPSGNKQANSGYLKRDLSEDSNKKLTYCLLPKAQYGRYSSFDGGKSAALLLQKGCPSEYMVWVDSCTAEGSSEESCVAKAAIMAQVAIKMFNK